ncbi:HAD family hydrolase [Thalassotalea sp. G20_0]|uniref:DUF2608 domain-containing protein n=1 Tax=Thalassotalea sp. G20_0 TaxID=2821093 RepID=UPI001ADCEDAD|nr:HAD family hydrolase [Thalassotalea sp. G20_0]MBO9495996.1 HAD family hydrolase [Thalassotalea sp. G20_0]
MLDRMMPELDKILIESISTQLKSNLDSGEYQCHNNGGRPYLTNSRGSVLCIYNGEFSDELDQIQPYISEAQDFYDLLPPDIKALAQRKITASNPHTAGASLQTKCSVETNPDATQLTETQCQILKTIFDLQTGVYFNQACQAITSIDELHCYRPDNLNGGWTTSPNITPLANFAAIEQQYTQWVERSDAHHASAMQSPSQHSATGITQTTCHTPLPIQDREYNVKSIAAVIDYVTPGYHPLVMFNVDQTLVTLDFVYGQLKRVAVENDIERTLQRIRQKAPDAHIIVLTRATATAAREKLQKANIDERLFDSIESVADKQGTEGSVMEQYIEKMPERPAQVCFVGNTVEMLANVEFTCKNLQIHYNTFHYTGAEEIAQRASEYARNMPWTEVSVQYNRA